MMITQDDGRPAFVAIANYTDLYEDGSQPRWAKILPLRGNESVRSVWRWAKGTCLDGIEIREADAMLAEGSKGPNDE